MLSVVGSSRIDIDVPDAISPVSNYEVWRSSDGSATSAVRIASVVTGSHTDTGLSAGTTYYYFLRSCNADGCSNLGLGSGATTEY